MQLRKATVVAAGLSLALFLAFAVRAQQNPVRSTATSPPAAKPPASSQTTIELPKHDGAKVDDSAAGNSGGDAKTPDNGSIHVTVNEVIVPVTVTDEKGRFVSDLNEKDFHVLEENKPQAIRYFTRERSQPVVIGFLLDLSTASRVHWKNYQDAGIELIQNLLTGDKKYAGYLIDYAQDAEVAVNTTSDPEPLVEKMRTLKPGGGSAMYDAIYLACTSRKLVHGEPIEPRRVIVIIGDGHDNSSKHSLNQIVELAQKNLVTIYCISTAAFGFTNESDNNLVRLAQETGGRVVYPLGDVYKDTDGYLSHPSDDGNYALTVGTGAYRSAVDGRMYHAVADIAGEVTTQYIIRYISDNQTNKAYRNVKVIVDLGGVRVRARKGYYASTP